MKPVNGLSALNSGPSPAGTGQRRQKLVFPTAPPILRGGEKATFLGSARGTLEDTPGTLSPARRGTMPVTAAQKG